jgi:hypothetical protein
VLAGEAELTIQMTSDESLVQQPVMLWQTPVLSSAEALLGQAVTGSQLLSWGSRSVYTMQLQEGISTQPSVCPFVFRLATATYVALLGGRRSCSWENSGLDGEEM